MLAFIDWQPDVEIVTLGPVVLRWYSMLWCIGLLSAYLIVQKLYQRENISSVKFEPLFFYCFVGVLVGARLGHCLFYEPDYYLTSMRGFMEMFLPIRFTPDLTDWTFRGYEGLASHGGTIGLFLALWLYARNNKLGMLGVIDNVALSVPLVSFCIRMGNLMNSEIIGDVTDVPWAFIFHSREALVDGQLVPRHPAQLYEALAYLVIFFVQLYLFKKHDLPHFAPSTKTSGAKIFTAGSKAAHGTAAEYDLRGGKTYVGNGYFFGFTLLSIFTFRFFVEFIKKEQVDFEQGMLLDMGQLLSIPFVIIGAWLMWNACRRISRFGD